MVVVLFIKTVLNVNYEKSDKIQIKKYMYMYQTVTWIFIYTEI